MGFGVCGFDNNGKGTAAEAVLEYISLNLARVRSDLFLNHP
jgi:hypothetical protein